MLQNYFFDPLNVIAPGALSDEHREVVWRPQVDIVEGKDEYRLYLDLPGIDPAQIDITEEKNMLTVEARRDPVELRDGECQSRNERRHGVFRRQFTLPDDADIDAISAESKHGVLVLTVGRKRPVETLRKIEIKQ
jgi:HSP20 family protein